MSKPPCPACGRPAGKSASDPFCNPCRYLRYHGEAVIRRKELQLADFRRRLALIRAWVKRRRQERGWE